MDRMRPGQVLKVVSTDAGSVRDMQAYANQTRNPLLQSLVEDQDYVFFLRKDGPGTR